MKVRLIQPKNSKYYIRTVTGGLNNAVAGSPTISGANVLCNCVGYANGRFNEIINDPNLTGTAIKFKYQLVCNAENFIESAKKQGLSVSSAPVEGGIMVWQKGKTLGGGDGAGHVAVVEEVYNDGSIMTSESGYGAWAFKTVRRSNSNGRWGQSSAYKFRGCIINPSIKNPKTVPVPPLVVDGIGGEATVRAMQRFFGTVQDGVITGQMKSQSKYYPALKSVEFGKGGSICIKNMQRWLGIAQDGILGQNTVKALQYVIGVNNDGIMGAGTMRAWQKYLNTHDKAVYPTLTNADKIVAQAKALAWAKGTAPSKYAWKGGSATSAFKVALNKAYPNRKSWGKAPKAGCCCDVFVGTVINTAGIGVSNFPRGFDQQKKYTNSHFNRYTYKNVTPYSVSKDGDIVMYYKKADGSSKHVLLRGNGYIYEAQYEKTYGHTNTSLSKIKKKMPYVVILRAK